MVVRAGVVDPAEAAAAPFTTRMFFAVFPSIMLPMFLAAIEGSIVSTALPAMAGALGNVERVPWVVVSYLLAATIAAPIYGRLADVLGRRRMLLVCLTINLLTSMLCGLAWNLPVLIMARLLQGFGAGGLMTLSQALIGEVVPIRQRGRFQGYNSSIFVFSSLIGPVAGGWLTQQWGWPAVFWVNVPISMLAMLLALRLKSTSSPAGRLHFDFVGTVFFALFIGPALLALEQARTLSLESLAWGMGFATVAGISLILLLRQERRAAFPLLPIAFLRQSAVWRTDALAATSGATFVSLISFVPIYLSVARGASPGQVGLLMLPLTALGAVGSLLTGRTISRTGRTAIFPSIAMPVVAVMMAFIAIAGPSLSLYALPWLFGVVALCNGTAMTVVQITVQVLAGPNQLGVAAASVQFSRSIGAAAGTAAVGAVLFGTLAVMDPDSAALFNQIVQRGLGALSDISPVRLSTARGEIDLAFRAAFLAVSGFATLSAVLAWSLPLRRI